MNERMVMTARIAAALLAATPAVAAARDVAHCPGSETCRSALAGARYDLGVPVPRLRSFAHAPWTGADVPQPLKSREFRHE